MTPHTPKSIAYFFATLTLGAASSASAEPRISSVSGDVQEGGTVTISGSEFSVVDTSLILYDQAIDQVEQSSLQDGDSVPEDTGTWSQNTNIYGNPVTVTLSGDLRTQNTDAVYYGSVKSFLGWPRIYDNTSNRVFYVSWWYKPSQTADSGGSNKYIRIWDREDGNGTRISWTQMHMTYSGSGGSQTNWATTQPTANQWNRMEIYVDSDRNSISAWVNGERKHQVGDFAKASTSDGLTIGLVGFDSSIASNYPNYSFRMNDIYASPTPARVELSDSATWDLTSKREVLHPTSWDEGKISVTMNYFSHSPSDNLYIYVVDDNGVANNSGYPLCDKCPDAPESVTIQ